MKKVVVLTGAGISAESGISTFRDAGGLWEGHDVMEVASPQGWKKNKSLVLDFYNQRRKQAAKAVPNEGHLALVELERSFDVTVITQNVDNLHEKAGSSSIIHLHGELSKAQSTLDENLIYNLGGNTISEGDLCEKGGQLRPHIVWFGEAVPKMDQAIEETIKADFLIIIGTSMMVYPAASLIDFARPEIHKFIVDPIKPQMVENESFKFFTEAASTGVPKVVRYLADKS